MLLVFLISGLWHGAGWNFIIWGGLAGLALVAHRIFHNAGLRLWAPLGWLLTFVYMAFVWMFFYTTNSTLLCQYLEQLSTPENYHINGLISTLNYKHRIINNCYIPFMIVLSLLCILAEAISWKKYQHPYKILLHPISCSIMVAIMILLYNPTPNQFIYFAF
ncbi:MAG: hypothetical protein J6V25_13315, partial [Oscillospiraceae bacterium]|nr:hypothetical protein [Oscillospiraceae bacterium]